MPWVVDTCLLLDIGLDDPHFAGKTEFLLKDKIADGLLICPVTFIELAPGFGGQTKALEEFLFNLGIGCREDWTWDDTKSATGAWSLHVRKRRAKQAPKRPVADIMIGAFASRFQGLLTRNAEDFNKVFPNLTIVEPR